MSLWNPPGNHRVDSESAHQLRRPLVSNEEKTQGKLAALQVEAKYVISDSRRNKRNCCVAISTVFVVVTFVCVLQNAIQKSPIVFLKLSEDQVGEYDLYMIPSFGNTNFNNISQINFALNETDIAKKLKEVDLVKGTTPRWTFLGRAINRDHPEKNASTIVLVINSEQEKKIGLGRSWMYRPLGEQETYVSAPLLRNIDIKPNRGERILLRFDFIELATTTGLIDEDKFRSLLDDAIRNALRNATLVITKNDTIRFIENLLNITLPDTVTDQIPDNITVPIDDLLTDSVIDSILDQLFLQNGLRLDAELIVLDAIEKPKGKWPNALGNVVVLEQKYLPALIKDLLPVSNPVVVAAFLEALGVQLPNDTSPQDAFDTLDNFPFEQYAFSVVVMYRDRLQSYVKDLDGLDLDMIQFTNEVADAIGYDFPATFTLPIVTALQGLYYIRLFLDQIFNSVVVVLVLLSMMLIYSLLLSDVEEKTYEYGMLRALGLKHNSLIELLLMQALYFAVPGIGLGLLVAFLLNIPVAYLIANFSATDPVFTLHWSAVVLAVLLGLLMPVVANILPIQRALSRTLRDSLDLYHQVFGETTVKIMKLENLGLSPWQLALSIMMVLVGFVVYYLIPYSFTFDNLPMFLGILNAILLGMVLGASMVAATLQPTLERWVLHLLMWGKDRNLKPLVTKSLTGHKRRNRKTALMFTTSLAFIIFAGAMFTLQARSIVDNIKVGLGADVVFKAPEWSSALDEDGMAGFLKEVERKKDSPVEAWSFVTFPLSDAEDVTWTGLSNLAGVPTLQMEVVALDRVYLKTIFEQFYIVTETDDEFSYKKLSDGKPDTVRSLYTDAGKATLPQEKDGLEIPPIVTNTPDPEKTDAAADVVYRTPEETYTEYLDVIVAESLRDAASVNIDTPLRLTVSVKLKKFRSTQIDYLCKTRAMLSKLPGFFFSSYRQLASVSPVIITMDNYERLLQQVHMVRFGNTTEDDNTTTSGNSTATNTTTDPFRPPKGSLLVRLKADASQTEREFVINGLRNFITDDRTIVFDTTDLINTTQTATTMILVFFYIVSIIATILCFFVLWLSFTANVRENSWEFGVLRAVGLSSRQVIRVYIYEALCIIITSIFLGSCIGLLVAVTLTLQFNLFLEMPFTFDFPYALFFSVVVMSVAVGIIGSYLPARKLQQKPIAIALRGGA